MSKMFNPPHPGEVLRDGVFTDTGLTVTEAARQLGISRVQLSKVLNGKSGISADLAVRLGLWLGHSPESWLRMQADYDLWQAEQKPQPNVVRARLAAA